MGGTAPPPAPGDKLSDRPAPVHGYQTEVEIFGGMQSLNDPDLDDTYGLVPSVGAGLTWRLGRDSRLFLLAAYSQATGDPYYDTPTFSGGKSRLRIAPVTLGLRDNFNPGGDLHFDMGLAFQGAWVEEHHPGDTGWTYSSGVIFGVQFMAGPQWRLQDGRQAVGLDLGWGRTTGEIGKGTTRYDMELKGFQARLYYAMRLSNDPTIAEVR